MLDIEKFSSFSLMYHLKVISVSVTAPNFSCFFVFFFGVVFFCLFFLCVGWGEGKPAGIFCPPRLNRRISRNGIW